MEIINSDSFKKVINEKNKTVLVDFSASWCGPCKMLAPILEQVATQVDDSKKIYKLDIDESLDIAKEFGVMSVPTMIIFKEGKEISRLTGLRQKSQIIEELNK